MEQYFETLMGGIFTPLECAVIIAAIWLYHKHGFIRVKAWIDRQVNNPENKLKRFNYMGCIDISPPILNLTRSCIYIVGPMTAINVLAFIVFSINGDINGADHIVGITNYFTGFAALLLIVAIGLTFKRK